MARARLEPWEAGSARREQHLSGEAFRPLASWAELGGQPRCVAFRRGMLSFVRLKMNQFGPFEIQFPRAGPYTYLGSLGSPWFETPKPRGRL